MDNLKNFVVNKGLEVADSINTGFITLNGKSVSGLVDSSNVLGLIDSAYVSSRSSGVDSAATSSLIDSAFVQARESVSISSFNTIAVAGQTNLIADSVGLSWRNSTEQAALINSDFSSSDAFGRFVDLAGDYALVSATAYDQTPYENNGAAFIFKRTDSAGGTGWAEQYKIYKSSSSHSQSFSWAVSLNDSATSALISNGGGSPLITQFSRDSANSTIWTEGQSIGKASGVGGSQPDWARDGALEQKGNYFAVGAKLDYGNGSSSTKYGSAWVYNRDSSGGLWAVQQELIPSDDSDAAGEKKFGTVLSMPTDSLVAVSAPNYVGSYGAVYIFERDGSTWSQTHRIIGPDGANMYFGAEMQIDGDYMAVSSTRKNTNTGEVYIYKKISGTWVYQQSVQASDASTGKYFGSGLALRGDQLLVAAYAANNVYVFQRFSEEWREVKKIEGSSLSSGTSQLGGGIPGGIQINKDKTKNDFILGDRNVAAYVFKVPTGTGPSDTLTLEAGSGITITTDTSTKKVTIAGSAAGNDSATTIALIDSSYVQARQTKYTNADFTDSAYVTTQINSVIDAAPGALNTLNELAAALGDDANFSTTITNQIAGKLDSAATTALIDSSYVQARAPAAGNDSATTIALVDSSYVQARQITPISAFNTITVATQNDVVADSAAISYENTAQQAILQASNRSSYDNFGSRVAIDNGYAIVTASSEDTGGSNAGSVYVQVRSGTTWSQQQQITSPITNPGNKYFGTDVDIEGSRVVIGSKYDDTDYNHGGGVHVYTRSGTTWSLEQRLASTDIAASDWFGDRVAISGNYIVASAHKKNSSEGAVYVFKGATSTTLQGASYDSVQSVSLNAIESQPKSMLFNSDGTKVYIVGMSSDAIKQYSLATPYDISTNFLSNASSSYSLTISGENNMGVYAMRWNSDGTKVYVLCNNNMKIYQHNLTTAYDISTASYSNKNFSSTTQENNYRGFTFNNDGTSMYLCGAQNNKVFQYTLSTAYDISTASYASKSFTHQASHGGPIAIQFDESGKKLFILGNSLRQHDLTTAFDVSSSITVSYAINILTNATQAGDFTFNADMSKLYAVEPGADKIFQFSTSGASTVWAQQAKLLASDNTTGDKFGFDVDIDGDTIAIGAAVADTGGKVYAFTRSGTTWSQQAAFTSSDISSEHEFGGSVSISGDTILVGAYNVDGASSAPYGAAYAFTRSGTTWSQQAKIQPDDVGNDYSGTTAFAYRNVSLEGDVALVGWNRATFDGTAQTGAAYIFKRSGTTWTQLKKIGASDATAADGFGNSTAIDGRDIIIGASGENSARGQAYTFVVPDAALYSDTLTLAGGSGITLTTNATTDTVTITGVAAGNDSATTIALIDSSYVQARAPAGGNDSATTIALIDSSYVQARALASASVTSSATAPSSPSSGDMWFDTTDTSLLVYYADSDGAQWVDISGATGATGPAGPSGSPEIIKIDSDLTTTDSDQVIHSFSKSTYRTIKYTAQLENDDSSGYHAEELLLTHNGTNVAITSYAKLALDSDLGIFDAAINGSNVELRLTPTKVNTHVKLRAITITEGNATPNDINALLIPIDSDLTTTDSDQVIHSFSKSTYRTMKYVAQLKHAGSNAYHSQEILLAHNGTNVATTGYAKLLLDSSLGTFDAAINGSNVELRLTPAKTNTNVKLRAIRTTV